MHDIEARAGQGRAGQARPLNEAMLRCCHVLPMLRATRLPACLLLLLVMSSNEVPLVSSRLISSHLVSFDSLLFHRATYHTEYIYTVFGHAGSSCLSQALAQPSPSRSHALPASLGGGLLVTQAPQEAQTTNRSWSLRIT
ncbi:hypothetical protein KVR01_006220 [Diaporthe batatas]|uniref:uncharacterized protein n=1 Tax=Diaporthe batatas TaxID=748121 RepID=UPI001D03D1D4|nr:uncharacterized protein KVR01_006220 [Diaporthe batatas]KAG8164302.1 hypothetical protein KVR01_006220 [Diaporthe batatas]